MPFGHKIVFQDVSFQYGPNSPSVLTGINLEIKKGSRVGFIGTTGSGKSTLIDLVMALLQPSKGKLRVDDTEITNQNSRQWQMHIAHVPQTIFLSDATVAENIALGTKFEDIDWQRVTEAAEKAQISETIESLEFRYHTKVGERGVRLSGGQRQRIGLARALYKRADVIILDEATSALDPETERNVMNAIEEISDEVTLLIIAHRRTTLAGCDSIVELENGIIRRMGTYEETIGKS
jgi:ATP-binding cassette subfamily B protein